MSGMRKTWKKIFINDELTVIAINILFLNVIFTSLNVLFCPQCVMDFILSVMFFAMILTASAQS